MRRLRIALVLTVLALVPWPAAAQEASPNTDTQLEMRTRQRRTVVRPVTPPETVEQDAEAARAEVEHQRHERESARAVTRPGPRRPDLDYDVKSGIQSQRLNDALRSR
jgi:hypothetical protein